MIGSWCYYHRIFVQKLDFLCMRAEIVLICAKPRQGEVGGGQIAAIASVHGFTVATRDTAPFIAAGVRVTNPWTAD